MPVTTPESESAVKPPIHPRLAFALAVLFFCSGAVALVYEMLWLRRLALVFGSAAPAMAATLAAYFAGLGCGAYVLGRMSAHSLRPLRWYAALELLIGLGALAVNPILDLSTHFFPALFGRLSNAPAAFIAVKTILAFVALFLPTFCMGGTLPLLGAALDAGRRHLGTTAGLLYTLNTFGAAVGTLAAPFILLPSLGGRATLWICVATNLALALAAWGLDRRTSLPLLELQPMPGAKPVTAGNRGQRGGLLALAGLSGAVTFSTQVLWTRAFQQVHENSLHSLSVVVAVFILGLAIGAALLRAGLGRQWPPDTLFVWSWWAGGAALALGPIVFVKLTNGLAYLPPSDSPITYALRLLWLAGAVMLIPVVLLGIALPALMEMAGARRGDHSGRLLGGILAANTAGSVAGALLGGIALPQWFGLWNSLLVISTFLLLTGSALAGRLVKLAHRWLRLALPAAAIVLIAILWWMDLPRVRLNESRGERLLSVVEGTHGIVAVVERAGSRRLKLNNHYALGGTASTGDERVQAHLPLLLHPAPNRVAFLGLGTGLTAGGALFHPTAHIVALELVPEVIDAARKYFSPLEANLFGDPRVKVIAEDARNYLRGSGEKFDVIIGDLVVPWRQGEGALFTREQFEAAKFSLNTDGLFCQWLPLFQLAEEDVRSILRTFLGVFPEASVWRGDFAPDEPALALIGSPRPFAVDPTLLTKRVHEMRADPSNPHFTHPAAVWMYFAGVLDQRDAASYNVPMNTEDFPVVEWRGPLRRADGRGTPRFTGNRLEEWLDHLAAQSAQRLTNLPPVEKQAIRAGRLMAAFSLATSSHQQQKASHLRAELRQSLPSEVFKSLFGSELPP